MMVFSTENKMYMIHPCSNCPGTAAIMEYLQGALESNLGEDIMFQQWQGTDRAMLVSQAATVRAFTEISLEALNKLTGHSFIAKSQAKYLKGKRMTFDSTCIMLPGLLKTVYSLFKMRFKDFIGTSLTAQSTVRWSSIKMMIP